MKNLELNEMENVSGGLSSAAGCALSVVAGAAAIVSFASGVGAGLGLGLGLHAGALGNNCDGVEGSAI